jgi:NAD(P)-dependent dehydrogenase (short-subunit alcohol dehydrogenase family)
MKKRTAIVTGANRGIGLEVCRQLAAKNVHVMLTARDPAKGEPAAASLREQGLDVVFHPLDVKQEQSIQLLRDHVAQRHGAADILINNAGILADPREGGVLDSKAEAYRKTLETNFYGALAMCLAFTPLMLEKGYGRVVNVSSGMGQLSDMQSGMPAYRISKTALNALTRTLAAELNGRNVLVNCVCPGWVKTDMGGAGATRSVEQGADTIVWLATLPDGGPSGGYFRDRKPIPW